MYATLESSTKSKCEALALATTIRCGKLWIRSFVVVCLLGLAFAYGVGVGLRSWFPYEILAKTHQAVTGNGNTQHAISAEELASGAYVIHLRHAHRAESIDIRIADYFERESAISDFSAMTCLSEEGRLQAELTGFVFGALGLTPTQIITSGSCRANEHAMIAFGRIDSFDSRHLYASAIPESQRQFHVDGQAKALEDAFAGGG